MTTLYKYDGKNYNTWSSGSTRLITDREEKGRKQIISVKCSFGEHSERYYALFDTGSRYTVVPEEIANSYDDCFFPLEGEIPLSTRFGPKNGMLYKCDMFILADLGEDLSVNDSTVLVLSDWPGPIVIGFTSCLEKIRWACDPTINNQGRLYFGIN